jgi:hypothetical protein
VGTNPATGILIDSGKPDADFTPTGRRDSRDHFAKGGIPLDLGKMVGNEIVKHELVMAYGARPFCQDPSPFGKMVAQIVAHQGADGRFTSWIYPHLRGKEGQKPQNPAILPSLLHP